MRGHIALQLRKVTRVPSTSCENGAEQLGMLSGLLRRFFESLVGVPQIFCRIPGGGLPRAENGPRGTPTAKILGSPATRARTARNPSPPEVALARANCGQARRA